MTEAEAGADTDTGGHRAGWLLAQGCFAVWFASAVYLSYRVFVVGLSPAQQQAAEQVPHQPSAVLAEPLIATLFAAVLVGIGIVCAIIAYGYAQYRAARRRRRELEPELDLEPGD